MQDKVAIVTGASSGIGRSTALLLAEKGCRVIAVGRNEKELSALRSEASSSAGSIKSHLADVREESLLDRIITEAIDSYGQIDILVNSAGVIKSGSVEATTLDDWDKMMQLNVRSVFGLMQRCIPHLEKTKGNIVNVSSVAGTRAFPNLAAYSVSKAAVDQLTRCAALDLASKGIRVNAVNPGVVVTNLHLRGGMEDEAYKAFLEHSKDTHPLGRAGEASEVAELIVFLASEKAAWITGGTFAIDGGRALTCLR